VSRTGLRVGDTPEAAPAASSAVGETAERAPLG